MSYFSALWDIIGTNFGLMATVVGLGVGVYFAPTLKLKLLAGATGLVLLSSLIAYNFGVKDGKELSDASWKSKQSQTDKRVEDAVSRSVDAVFDGVRDDPWDSATGERGKKAR